jgi:acetylglutamate kinase
MKAHADLASLRTAIPYIRRYKGHVFVIKLGGELCRPGDTLDHVVEQIALLYQLGIKVVLVHGGGPQADELAERLGRRPERVAGRRVTDGATLEIAKMAFAGVANTDLLAALRRASAPAVGLSGVDAALLCVTRRPPTVVDDPSTGETREVDFGHVGDIQSVRPHVLRLLLDAGYIPVIASLAADDGGQVLNVNADTIATRIAVELNAEKYFVLTGVDGVLRNVNDASTLCPFLDLAELERLEKSGVVAGGMLPKLAACKEALRRGVPRVHIINGAQPDTLLAEVFTNEGAGTLLVEKRAAAGAAPSAK